MSAKEPRPAPGAGTSPRAHAGRVVLLVDDNPQILDSVGSMLAFMGYTPVLAPTGEAALAQLASGLEPILVILDLDMPGLGGARTLPLLRTLRPDLPVLISTGGGHPQIADLVRSHAHVGLLPKPYGLKQLQERLS